MESVRSDQTQGRARESQGIERERGPSAEEMVKMAMAKSAEGDVEAAVAYLR